MRHFLQSGSVAHPRGLISPRHRVRIRPYGRATFAPGEIVELDQAMSLPVTLNMDEGKVSSGYYNARLPTSAGAKWGRVHAIIEDNVPQGQECWALVRGVATVNGTGDNGVAAVVAVEGDADLHGRRAKGIIIDSAGAGQSVILWDGFSGFGTLQTPGGGGGGDSEGSEGSDAGSDTSDDSDGSDTSGGGGDVVDDIGSEIGGSIVGD